eukprot:SAG31_NODE_1129_length_9755_cov_2.095070_16_plen_207_part_00
MDRVQRKYEHYPSETQIYRKKLKDKMYSAVRVATQRLKRAAKLTDLTEIDQILLDYPDPGEQLSSVMEIARRHRQNLLDSLFFRLKSAVQWESARDIDKLLHEVEKMEDGGELEAERTALKEHRKALIDSVNEANKELAQGTDFKAIESAIKKYTLFAEETTGSVEALEQQRDNLIQIAKQDLAQLIDLDVPQLVRCGSCNHYNCP